VLVLKGENDRLQLLVHPQLESVIEKEDVPYVYPLLRDLLLRAEELPDELFEQISTLGIGTLVTRQAGSNLTDHPILGAQVADFVPLHAYLDGQS
jgi:hypothetical protein